jgi:predicted porin
MITRSIAAAVALATLSAGVANAAEDFEIGISGFLHNAVSASDVDSKANENDVFSVLSDNLISFNGATVLDNGLKATAVASFSFALGANQQVTTTQNNVTTTQGNVEDQNNIYKEEIYVGLGGSFGQVDIGRRRNAASLLHTFIPSAGVGTFGVDDARMSSSVAGTVGFSTATSTHLNNVNEYANRIQYFTPRIEGLQLAASYTPDTNPDAANGGRVGVPTRYNSVGYKNEYSLAGNYSREFNGVGAVASVGYTAAEASAATSGVANPRDFEALHAGLQLSAHGFTVGGAYGQQESANQYGSTQGQFTSGKDRRFGGGVKYETGPWGFGVSYLQRRASGTTQIVLANGQEVRTSHLWELAGTYDLGPGVTAGTGVYYNDNVRMTANMPGKATRGAPEDSITGVVNLSVNF